MLRTRSNTFEENLIGKKRLYIIYDLPKGIKDLLNGGQLIF